MRYTVHFDGAALARFSSAQQALIAWIMWQQAARVQVSTIDEIADDLADDLADLAGQEVETVCRSGAPGCPPDVWYRPV